MRANVTVVVELPCALDDMLENVRRLTESLEDPEIFQGRHVGYDQRDPDTKPYISFTVGGRLKKVPV